jgi:hypothetical protein
MGHFKELEILEKIEHEAKGITIRMGHELQAYLTRSTPPPALDEALAELLILKPPMNPVDQIKE